jgi:serine/threonine protein kinase
MHPPIIHRDIKPSNMLRRSKDGRILLIDFGIARATNPKEHYWIGTPGYAPAEQQAGKHESRSDLYAVGASMHELLTGIHPAGFDFPGFDDCGVKVHPKLEEAVGWALATFPEERIPDAGTFRSRLEEVLGYSPVAQAETGFSFATAVDNLKRYVIDAQLKALNERYGNESMTPYWPAKLDYLVFTLGQAPPIELIIKRNDTTERIEFLEKQGILSPQTLGSIDPRSEEDLGKIPGIFEQFCADYEQSKFAF